LTDFHAFWYQSWHLEDNLLQYFQFILIGKANNAHKRNSEAEAAGSGNLNGPESAETCRLSNRCQK
jgi:hypothetical protein